MKRVLIVEDQRFARDHLESCVLKNENYYLVKSVTSAIYAEEICKSSSIDLIIMDVCTEFDADGIEAAKNIKNRYPDIKIIIVTSMIESDFLRRAKEAGVDSFWYKDVGIEELAVVMDKTMNGESLYPAEVPSIQVGLCQSCDFTESELKVLRVLCEGLSFKEMSERLGIEVSTVHYHVNNMLRKTGYPNRNRLVIAVINKKLIVPGSDRDLFG